ncbi:MAG: LptF/LptG family permease [Candidatus Omnitrophica bacterium]|nr:LptF/LptG family permease [Candidatus Omnitrophota bacterium]
MKTLKTAISNEWFLIFLLSLLTISFILIVGNVVKLIELVIAKGVNFADVGKLFLFLIPSLFIFSLPVAVLAATVLTFGRMGYDNEITALRASGCSLYRILGYFIIFGLFFSALSLWCNDTIIPYAHYETRKILKSIGIKNPASFLEERTFIKAFQEHILFIYRIKQDKLEHVKIYQPHSTRPTRTITAESGEFIPLPEKNAIKLILRNGMADEPSIDGPTMFYQLKFKTYYITLQLGDADGDRQPDKKIADMSFAELNREILSLQSMGIDSLPLQVGLHRKLSLSASPLLFILIGLPLGINVRRRERSLGFAISLAICLLYYLVMALGESLALRGILDPFSGGWLPSIILALAAGLLIIRNFER